IIAKLGTQQKRLIWSGAIQRDQDIGNVLFGQMMRLIGDLQSACVGKCFQQRRDVIAKLAVADSALLQDVASEHIKVKLRRNPKMSVLVQNSVNQPRVIQNGIARFDIAQQIDKRK